MKNILITGGAGFIGSNFIAYFLEKYPTYQIINLDKLTYAGNVDNLTEVVCNPNYHFVQGDIADKELVESLFKKFDFQGVINFAAETHVDSSILDPTLFVTTNLEGTLTLLEAARLHWIKSPGVLKENHTESRFLQVSTDEVYGSLGPTGFFTEETPYAPNNPYSATKAGADLLIRSYVHTYGLNAVITHASNNYGPRQYPEKLIPKVIQHALSQQPIPIHGKGTAVRDWLYVLDHCKGVDMAFHHGKKGEHYNLGGNCEKTNLEIAHDICVLLDELLPQTTSYLSLITFVTDRPGNDQRYALNTQKAKQALNWQPEEKFEHGLKKTVAWYIKMFNKSFNLY